MSPPMATCFHEMNHIVPLFSKIKILISCVPCSPKLSFVPVFPNFMHRVPCTTELNASFEQSEQGLHCLPFRLHRLDSLLYCKVT